MIQMTCKSGRIYIKRQTERFVPRNVGAREHILTRRKLFLTTLNIVEALHCTCGHNKRENVIFITFMHDL
jgi:hypothetical protein